MRDVLRGEGKLAKRKILKLNGFLTVQAESDPSKKSAKALNVKGAYCPQPI